MFDKMRKQAAPGTILAAMSQAVSRITHEHQRTRVNIQRMVAGAAVAYPNHCLWMLAAVRNSETESRTTAAKHVLDFIRDKSTPQGHVIMDAHEVVCRELKVRSDHARRGVSYGRWLFPSKTGKVRTPQMEYSLICCRSLSG